MILQKEYSRSDFINQIISKPFCTDDFNRDGIYRANKRQALNKVYIEHNNDSFINSIVFDIDTETAAIAWQDANIPIPNFITQNPANGHAHLFYALSSPVCITENARRKPQKLLKGVIEGLTERLGANPFKGRCRRFNSSFKCRFMLYRQDNKEPFKFSLEDVLE